MDFRILLEVSEKNLEVYQCGIIVGTRNGIIKMAKFSCFKEGMFITLEILQSWCEYFLAIQMQIS